MVWNDSWKASRPEFVQRQRADTTSSRNHKEQKMKKQLMACLVGGLTFGLAACGGTSTPASGEETRGVDPYTYLLDGKTSSAEEVERLSKQVTLSYFMPSDKTDLVQVFTTNDGFEAYKRQYLQAQSLQPQFLCVSLRTRTTIYDFPNYGGDQEDVLKGTSLPNLGTVLRSNTSEPNWNTTHGTPPNTTTGDISSIKMADCTWTRLYIGTNYSSNWSKLERKGGNLSVMPAGFNDTISSMIVDP
jgi:hypothetical protein